MLDISVSQIRNTVTFVVDKQSIALAKAAADNLQKHFQKIADPKIRFQAQKQRRQKARQQADDARFNDKPRDTKAAYELAQQKGIEMPITEAIYAVLYKKADVKLVVSNLMTRDGKSED